MEFLERLRVWVRMFWELARFNVSLWALVTKPFCNYELNLVLLD